MHEFLDLLLSMKKATIRFCWCCYCYSIVKFMLIACSVMFVKKGAPKKKKRINGRCDIPGNGNLYFIHFGCFAKHFRIPFQNRKPSSIASVDFKFKCFTFSSIISNYLQTVCVVCVFALWFSICFCMILFFSLRFSNEFKC